MCTPSFSDGACCCSSLIGEITITHTLAPVARQRRNDCPKKSCPQEVHLWSPRCSSLPLQQSLEQKPVANENLQVNGFNPLRACSRFSSHKVLAPPHSSFCFIHKDSCITVATCFVYIDCSTSTFTKWLPGIMA